MALVAHERQVAPPVLIRHRRDRGRTGFRSGAPRPRNLSEADRPARRLQGSGSVGAAYPGASGAPLPFDVNGDRYPPFDDGQHLVDVDLRDVLPVAIP